MVSDSSTTFVTDLADMLQNRFLVYLKIKKIYKKRRWNSETHPGSGSHHSYIQPHLNDLNISTYSRLNIETQKQHRKYVQCYVTIKNSNSFSLQLLSHGHIVPSRPTDRISHPEISYKHRT